MRCGYFDPDKREYVITNPHTPVKWINYIGSRRFGGFVDHTGGALICREDPSLNRITKYIQQMPTSDFKGETLYIRVHQAGGYEIFSPFYVPTLTPLDIYECRIGLGYSRFLAEYRKIRVEVEIFVPLNATSEIRDIKIYNLADEPVELDVIPVVEFSHPNAVMQFTNADWVPQTMQCKAVQDGCFTILVQYPYMYRDTRINYLTSNQAVSSFEADRKNFLGRYEYGTFRLPLSLLEPELSNREALRGDTLGALMHSLGKIEPQASRRLIVQLGQAANLNTAREEIEYYRQPEAVDGARAKLREFWDHYLDVLQVETPDRDLDIMVNVHNPYQCFVTKTWSRYLSYYQLGLGSRGIGIRDSSQDVLSVFAAIPTEGKEFIRTLLSFQKRSGCAMHQFNPFTMEGSIGDSAEMEDRPHYYSDDHLWMVLAVCAYLKETGDLGFLDEVVDFYDKDKEGRPIEAAAVMDHLKRCLDFTRNDLGQHGLPLLGFADWNDTVNLPAGAESMFTANLYGKALQEMIALFSSLGQQESAALYQQAYAEMKSRFEAAAWDGDYYLRYFDAEGQPVGSHINRYGKIYLNAQSWPVISGFASYERGRRAMDAVFRLLNTRYGIKLTSPGFNGYDPKYGGVTTYPPGAKENGGIFLHPNPWAIIAETILGNGDRAYQYYAQINPAAKNDAIEIYECEPYVFAQNILGDEHPQFGLARNSWLSGTASWSYLAVSQYILGIRPEYFGLCIDPCIPTTWKGYKAARIFRGSRYLITVHNPHGVSKGVSRLRVDGHEFETNLIDPNLPGSEHMIEVWLGG